MRPNRTTGPGGVSTVNLRPALHSKIRRVKLPGQASRRFPGRTSRAETAGTDGARLIQGREKKKEKAPGQAPDEIAAVASWFGLVHTGGAAEDDETCFVQQTNCSQAHTCPSVSHTLQVSMGR